MQTTGEVRLMVDGAWRLVPHYHRWTLKVGEMQHPVEFALHACPIDGKSLRISEVLTGHDTQTQVLSSKNHQPILLQHLRKGHRLYLAGHEVRKLARTAAYNQVKKVGEMRFLAAIAKVIGHRAAELAEQQRRGAEVAS